MLDDDLLNNYIGIIDLLICDIIYVIELECLIGNCIFDWDINFYIVLVDIIY